MKFIYILVGLFCVGLIILVLLSYNPPVKTTLQKELSEKYNAKLFFNPDSVFIASGSGTITQEIILDTNAPVTTVQIELMFNPNAIRNVTILPAADNFFGDSTSYSVILSEVREEIGRVSFAIEKNPNSEESTGEKPVATFSFQGIGILPETQVTFLNKSSVLTTYSRNSILNSTAPLTVRF